ncbi:MAG TPA: proline--tRNA ligase [Candidatus Binatia bacterium]|nr:proline--tRNA ligase [Candidatus Binatia bacterium]
MSGWTRHLGQVFGRTLRESPVEAESEGHSLLLRAGLVRQLSAGIFSALPLGWSSMQRIMAIIREEMNAIGGQEISMPVVQPADLWHRSGRLSTVDVIASFLDRAGREMVLGPTHEEVVATLASGEIMSWRQLPQIVYQIQTKYRDEPRPRAGLIRVREFLMKDAYSLDRDEEGLRRAYDAHHGAYLRIYERCGLGDVIAVRSDSGMMGGRTAHEFIYPSPLGEDTLVRCRSCGRAANRQVASFRKRRLDNGDPAPLERVATPGMATIEALAAFLGVSAEQTAKAVFFMGGFPSGDAVSEKLVMAMVRGDHEANETKIANAAGAVSLRPATADEIRSAGAEPGYASPIGIDRSRAVVVVDDLVAASTNLVSGANRPDVHLRNVNAGRDFTADITTDIAAAQEGAECLECGSSLELFRGIEVGNIFQLGTRYSEALGALYADEQGARHPIVMGSYGIGVGRLLACLAEKHHDPRGLALPAAVAPADVHIVVLATQAEATVDALAAGLEAHGALVIVDDREVSAGVKFADCDLIGAPLRVTVSSRSLAAGGVEVRRRLGVEAAVVAAEAEAVLGLA